MSNLDEASRVIAGVLLGGLTSAILTGCFIYLDIPYAQFVDGVMRILLPVFVSACVLLTRPLLLRTILRARRSPFLLDRDLNAILTGRIVGLILGACLAIALYPSLS